MFVKNFELTPQLEKMLDAVKKVDPGRYGMRMDQLEAIVRHCNAELFTVAVYCFNLGFLRGSLRMKKQYSGRRNNSLRKLLERFELLTDEQQQGVVDLLETAIKKVLG